MELWVMILEGFGDYRSSPREVLDCFVERYTLGEYSVLDEGYILIGEGEYISTLRKPAHVLLYHRFIFLFHCFADVNLLMK